MKKVLFWLILGTKGGYNRARIIQLLHKRPYNTNQISKILNLNYRTISHHLNLLEKMGVVISSGNDYGHIYFLSDELENSYIDFEEIWKKLEDE